MFFTVEDLLEFLTARFCIEDIDFYEMLYSKLNTLRVCCVCVGESRLQLDPKTVQAAQVLVELLDGFTAVVLTRIGRARFAVGHEPLSSSRDQ